MKGNTDMAALYQRSQYKSKEFDVDTHDAISVFRKGEKDNGETEATLGRI
jgi:hypothetical protein